MIDIDLDRYNMCNLRKLTGKALKSRLFNDRNVPHI